MNAKKLYGDYLKEVKLMQLATVKGDKPWLCNVWYVMDEEDNVYWISRDTRKHSEDIHDNPNVACTFHKWFDGGLLNDKGQAVIISGTAARLSGEECRRPYALYSERFPRMPEFQSLELFLNDESHHTFYKLTPEKIVWWDEVNFPDDSKQVIK